MLISLALMIGLSSVPQGLRAVGIVTSPDPARAVAVLRSEGSTRIVRIGDRAFGGRVSSITTSGVLLDFEDHQVSLGVEASRDLAPGPVEPLPAAAPEPGPHGAVMERAEVQRRLSSEVARILAETTLVPVTDQGGVAGFALTRVPMGTVLTDAGLRSGDVLLSINGIAIDSRATLLALWPRLQGEGVIRAELLRDGEPMALTVTLR